jgi:hypothetical protein
LYLAVLYVLYSLPMKLKKYGRRTSFLISPYQALSLITP